MTLPRADLVAHIPSLRRYARALTADPWAADDLVQDTLERACGKWRLWTPGTDLRAWLFTLMHNLHASSMRQTVRRGSAVNLEAATDGLAAPDAAQDLTIDLQRCLMQLPEDQRAVLLLVSLEDMGYAQVARVLDIPIGTVMSRLARARQRLQLLLDAPIKTPAAVIHLKRLK